MILRNDILPSIYSIYGEDKNGTYFIIDFIKVYFTPFHYVTYSKKVYYQKFSYFDYLLN